MYSIADTQTGQYLYSGRNAPTLEECVAGGLSFLMGDWDQDDINKVNNYKLEEKKRFLESFDLYPVEHADLIEEEEGILPVF